MQRIGGESTTTSLQPDIRKEQVANAVKFLIDPQIENAPNKDKILFLRNKGLTKQEIEAAMKQVEVEIEEAKNSQKNGSSNGEDNENKSSWISRILLPTFLAMSAGIGAGLAAKNSDVVMRTIQRYKEWQRNEIQAALNKGNCVDNLSLILVLISRWECKAECK